MAYKISDRCKGCDDCAQICPVRAITGEMKEKHEIDPNRCIDCGSCTHACEYEGIFDNNGKQCKFLPREQWKKPEVKADVCDGCGICAEECPFFCIEIVDGVSTLTNPEVCTGCGTCMRSCPIEAIKLK